VSGLTMRENPRLLTESVKARDKELWEELKPIVTAMKIKEPDGYFLDPIS